MVLVPLGPTGQRRDEAVFQLLDVLVLVHQDPAESRQQPLPLFVCFVRSHAPALEQLYRFLENIVEDGLGLSLRLFYRTGECRPRQSHGEGMTGKHRYSAGIVPYQVV